MSYEVNLPEFPKPEEQLAALSSVIARNYREFVLEGPLSAYFTVVRGGMMDAAQLLTDQVEASVTSFQHKISEVVAESDYFRTANKSIAEMRAATAEFKTLIDSLGKPPSEPSVEKTEFLTSE